MKAAKHTLHVAISAGEGLQERIFAPSEDVVIGEATGLIVPGWGHPTLLISHDGFLHLSPGMRVNMCADDGEDQVIGTYEELLANGTVMPIPIRLRRMNIRVRQGVSIFAKYIHFSAAQ